MIKAIVAVMFLSFGAFAQDANCSEEQVLRMVAVYPEPRLRKAIQECRIGFAWSEGFQQNLQGALIANVSLEASQRPGLVELVRGRCAQPSNSKARRWQNPRDKLYYLWVSAGPAKGFWLGETEVTQTAWQLVMGSNPSPKKGPTLPVERISYEQAVQYCSAIDGRLPEDHELTRAAGKGRYGPLNDIAVYDGNSGGSAQPVKSKAPNKLGFFDLLGNVSEWVLFGGYSRLMAYGGDYAQVPTKVTGEATRAFFDPSKVEYDRWEKAEKKARIKPELYVGVRCAGEFPNAK